jgi:hypothetical protein
VLESDGQAETAFKSLNGKPKTPAPTCLPGYTSNMVNSIDLQGLDLVI